MWVGWGAGRPAAGSRSERVSPVAYVGWPARIACYMLYGAGPPSGGAMVVTGRQGQMAMANAPSLPEELTASR